MDKELFERLKGSLEQGAAIHKGEIAPSRVFKYPDVDVKAIREKTHLSQSKFANAIGVSIGTLRNWEQKRRFPTGPARVLLTIFDRKPKAVFEALHIKS